MRVTIYYTNRFKGCPGGIEAFELEGPGPFRVNFESLDGGGRRALALKERLRGPAAEFTPLEIHASAAFARIDERGSRPFSKGRHTDMSQMSLPSTLRLASVRTVKASCAR